MREGCTNISPATLNVSRLKNLQTSCRERLELQLSSEARRIIDSFGNLCMDTLTSLENQHEDAGKVAVRVMWSQNFLSTQCLTEVEEKLFYAKTLDEVFKLLKKHNIISFINYKPLERIIADLGTEKDKHRLETYNHKLKLFCKRRVFEAPYGILTLGNKHENCSEFVLLMDKQMENAITFLDIKVAEEKIADILGLDSGAQILLH